MSATWMIFYCLRERVGSYAVALYGWRNFLTSVGLNDTQIKHKLVGWKKDLIGWGFGLGLTAPPSPREH